MAYYLNSMWQCHNYVICCKFKKINSKFSQKIFQLKICKCLKLNRQKNPPEKVRADSFVYWVTNYFISLMAACAAVRLSRRFT